tara:strand:+ start:168 stop:581 length:414 start_codon:yes stop_codon:yes gene_type:complete
MSALLIKKNLGPIPGGGTHGANALCCAAAKANIAFLTDPIFQEGFKQRAEYFEKTISELENLDEVEKVNVRGMIAGIIFGSSEAADAVVTYCLSNNILPVHTGKSSIKLGPPLTISKIAISQTAETIEKGIKNCLSI